MRKHLSTAGTLLNSPFIQVWPRKIVLYIERLASMINTPLEDVNLNFYDEKQKGALHEEGCEGYKTIYTLSIITIMLTFY
jgi:hypothetical protein